MKAHAAAFGTRSGQAIPGSVARLRKRSGAPGGRAYRFAVARIFLIGLVAAVLLFAVGLLGAAAFNPDDGFLVQSEPLWRLFGVTAYLGLAAAYLLPILAVGRLILLLVRWFGRVRCGV
jgi:hypothetical protein